MRRFLQRGKSHRVSTRATVTRDDVAEVETSSTFTGGHTISTLQATSQGTSHRVFESLKESNENTWEILIKEEKLHLLDTVDFVHLFPHFFLDFWISEEHKSTSVRTKVTQDAPSVRQCARLWKLHFQDMDYMRSVFVYILSSNAFNVTMLVLPVYLIESIQSHKLAVAYFPAVVFGGWSLAVVILERLLLIFGYKIMFCTSSIMMSCASIWFLTQSIRLSYLLYFPALTFGFSACVMMMTSQTMLYTSSKYHSSYLIGVDDFTKTMSEALLGFVVFVVMQTFPQGHRSQPSRESDQFLRLVMFLIPAINSAVSFVEIFFYTHIPKEKPSHIQYTRTLQQRLALQENYRADDLVIQEEDLQILQDLPSTNL